MNRTITFWTIYKIYFWYVLAIKIIFQQFGLTELNEFYISFLVILISVFYMKDYKMQHQATIGLYLLNLLIWGGGFLLYFREIDSQNQGFEGWIHLMFIIVITPLLLSIFHALSVLIINKYLKERK